MCTKCKSSRQRGNHVYSKMYGQEHGQSSVITTMWRAHIPARLIQRYNQPKSWSTALAHIPTFLCAIPTYSEPWWAKYNRPTSSELVCGVSNSRIWKFIISGLQKQSWVCKGHVRVLRRLNESHSDYWGRVHDFWEFWDFSTFSRSIKWRGRQTAVCAFNTSTLNIEQRLVYSLVYITCVYWRSIS